MIVSLTQLPQTFSQTVFPGTEENFKGKIIRSHHWRDWISSQVDPDLIRANVTSLDGETPYDYLLYAPGLDRTRSGRLAAGLLYRYQHLEAGGWWCNGVDPLRYWQPMTWGCFKPDRPYVDPKKQKPIKYEHPKGTARGTFFLNLPHHLSQKITDRYPQPQIPASQPIPTATTWEEEFLPADRPECTIDPSFWANVSANPAIPVFLTEGVKKAGCLISQGYAAIGLPGIHGGYATLTTAIGQETIRQLVRDLDCIATPGRTLYIAFDQDPKPTTRQNVRIAIRNLAALLTERGAKVKVITWAGDSKGIDDLVASEGAQALHSAVDQAESIETWTWKVNQGQQLTLRPTFHLNTPELKRSQVPHLPDRGLLVLASGKGTGKTNLLAELLQGESKVISIGHRIALQRNTCDRWNLNFKNDLDKVKGRFFSQDGYTLRIGLCIDSLLSISTEDVSGGILVIDEFMQVLRHLFLGQTCAKEGRRGALIEHLTHLIAAARLVILADADTCDAGINYIHQWRSDRDHLPVLVLNDYISQSFEATFLETRKIDDAYQRITEDLTAHQKTFIALDSRNGSTKLAAKLTKLFPEKQGLLINSQTSGEHEQRAFITNPNLHVHRYDWIIATPSLGTGVSIEVDHFDLVYGIFKGVLTDSDAAQALNRVRAKVPRILWAADRGQNQAFMSQSPNPRVIQRSIQRRAFMAAQIVRSQLGYKLSPHDREDDLSNLDPSVNFYCELLARENASHIAFKNALKARLEAEGSTVTTMIPNHHTEDFAQTMRDLSRQIKQDEAQAIAQARNLNPLELQALSCRENLSQEDQATIEKYRIQAFFCKTELTAEEIIFCGKYGSAIQQLEALLYGCAVSNTRDQAEQNAQIQWGALLTPWDLKCHEVKRFVREKLGVREFINVKAEWTSKSLESFAAFARSCRKDIKLYLNLTIKDESHNNWILSQFLTQIGLKTKVRYQGPRGKQEAVYCLDDEHLAIVSEILQRRQEYRLEQSANQSFQPFESESIPVSIPDFLYSEAGDSYRTSIERDSGQDPPNPTTFVSTDHTIQRFKTWVFDQNRVVRLFFYPYQNSEPIEITRSSVADR